MNAPIPNHETSRPNQPALPDAWVERLFDHMAALYGSKFADLWRGSDPAKVKAMWASKLGGFAEKPKAIKAALDALDERPFPPTLPEFIQLCRDAAKRFGNTSPLLQHKATPEERDHQREMSKRLGDAIGSGKLRDGIDEHWATHPRSVAHLRMIFDASKRDQRFIPCISQMVSDGICTEGGQLLRSYSGGQWQRA